MAFFVLLSALMAVKIHCDKGKTNIYVIAGIFCGLATGTKYTAFLSSAPVLIAHLFSKRKKGKKFFDKDCFAFILSAVLTFLLTTPFALFDSWDFLGAIRYEALHYRTGHIGSESPDSSSFVLYAVYLFSKGYGIILSVFSIAGILLFSKKSYRKTMILISAPLLIYLLVGSYKVFFERNLVSVIPFLSLFSAFFIIRVKSWTENFAENTGYGRQLANILILFLILSGVYFSIARSFSYVKEITLPDTRWISLQWIIDNIPAKKESAGNFIRFLLEDIRINSKWKSSVSMA